MTMNNNAIVVGIDGSEASLAALRWAVSEAVATRSCLEVVHAWHARTARDVAFGSAHELQRGSLCMVQNEVAAALVGVLNPPDVTQTSVHGTASVILLHRAENARLLVLGSHGRTELQDLILGRVARTCQRNARCPIVIVDRNGTGTVITSAATAAAGI